MTARLSPIFKRQLSTVAKAAYKLSTPSPISQPNLKKAKNIFLIRSATPDLFKKTIRELKTLAPKATLHIVSHQRDNELIKNNTPKGTKFYAYTANGNYSWENLAALKKDLLKAKLDTFVMLANNVYGYPHIANILYQLGAKSLFLFNTNERWYQLTRAELEFKQSASAVYQSICALIAEDL